eukprot:m.15729 g.15729  ORF g.15729 m.15729 type:complete len:739 (+) comp26514_c0_seq6:85-2301(+)
MALPGETCHLMIKAYIFRFDSRSEKWNALGERRLCRLQLLRHRYENKTRFRLVARSEGSFATAVEPLLQTEIDLRSKVSLIQEGFLQIIVGDVFYGLKFDKPDDAELLKLQLDQAIGPAEDDLPLPLPEHDLPPPRPARSSPSFASIQPLGSDARQQPVPSQRRFDDRGAPAPRPLARPKPVKSTSSMDESMIDSLREAIMKGDANVAKALVIRLADQKASLNIELLKGEAASAQALKKSRLKVMVEDRETAGGSFHVETSFNSTVRALKNKVYVMLNIPPQVQCWFYNQVLLKDDDRLNAKGIEADSVINLYLLSAKSVGLTKEGLQGQQRQKAQSLGIPHPHTQQDGRRPMESSPPIRPRAARPQTVTELKHPLADQLPNEFMRHKPFYDVDDNFATAHAVPVEIKPKSQKDVGWPCGDCTFINKPTRPGCEVCGCARPENYKVPENYTPPEDEKWRITEEERQQTLLHEAEEAQKRQAVQERKKNLKDLMHAADQDLIPSEEEFECPICFLDIEPGKGVRLRECLHLFCKDCLAEHVRSRNDPDIRCPYTDDNYECNEPLTEREMRRLITEEELRRLHSRGIDVALGEMGNSFYCRTPDCLGRCIYDDDVNDFDCPVCKKRNCLLCKAIHHPEMNCKEYQDDLKRKAANDVAARATQEMLDKMVQSGDAMHCPKCAVIVQKKDGCDWIRCSMCKTEICWATKGRRWGPKGKGDITGGCRCNVDKKKCHPKCRNCH